MAKDAAKSTSKPAETAAKTAEAPAPASTDSAPAAAESSPAAKSSGGGGSRPISYFSSVSTDEYRSGWDAIFGGKNEEAPAPKKARKPKLPATLEISLDELDADARASLEAAVRKRAKKKRLDYDALDAEGRVAWSIACTLQD